MSNNALLAIAFTLLALASGAPSARAADTDGIVVLQTDFGLKDQAVAAMRGVIRSVDQELTVDDLTHEIPTYNIWEAAYRLNAVIDYWPARTVFVSVVDPGVGTSRKSVVARLKSGQTIVTPDNGTLTLVAERVGVAAVREIDESKHRLPGSEGSYTFHGRDLYAYVGALLASGKLAFDAVGPLREGLVSIEYEKPRQDSDHIYGGIPVLDPQYGNVWTNIPASALEALKIRRGEAVTLTITEAGKPKVTLTAKYAHTFGDVAIGEPLLYANSVGMLAVAINQKDFADTYHIAAGPTWRIEITRAKAESL
jgi:S-adenosylmethionine hydrolase